MRKSFQPATLSLVKWSTGMDMSEDFQECEGILRFRVPIGDEAVEAFLSRTTCEASLRQAPGVGSLAAFYREYRPLLDGIVLGKVGAGARQPVVVMVRDLQPQPPDHRARQRSVSTGVELAQQPKPEPAGHCVRSMPAKRFTAISKPSSSGHAMWQHLSGSP